MQASLLILTVLASSVAALALARPPGQSPPAGQEPAPENPPEQAPPAATPPARTPPGPPPIPPPPAALLFLEGTWHGLGTSPYGPFEHETRVERRGPWLLLVSDVFAPGTDTLTFVSTQLYGADAGGLVLHLFDTAGAFEFRGEAIEDGMRFAWEGGESWKRTALRRQADGKVHTRYDSFEPSMFKDPVAFEGTWQPGSRPRATAPGTSGGAPATTAPGPAASGPAAAASATGGPAIEAALQPLLFLAGRWRGEGVGPYGAYAYEHEIERRGRWLLLRGAISRPGDPTPLFLQTGVMGVGHDGRPANYLFDAGGVTVSSGTGLDDGVLWESRQGESYRRTRLTRHPDGSIHYRGEIHLAEPPPGVPRDSVFESTARRH